MALQIGSHTTVFEKSLFVNNRFNLGKYVSPFAMSYRISFALKLV